MYLSLINPVCTCTTEVNFISYCVTVYFIISEKIPENRYGIAPKITMNNQPKATIANPSLSLISVASYGIFIKLNPTRNEIPADNKTIGSGDIKVNDYD